MCDVFFCEKTSARLTPPQVASEHQKNEMHDMIARMIHPRIELGPKAWQASIITTRLMNLEFDKGGVNIITIP